MLLGRAGMNLPRVSRVSARFLLKFRVQPKIAMLKTPKSLLAMHNTGPRGLFGQLVSVRFQTVDFSPFSANIAFLTQNRPIETPLPLVSAPNRLKVYPRSNGYPPVGFRAIFVLKTSFCPNSLYCGPKSADPSVISC